MLPSLFISHGAPTLVIEENPYTQFLRAELLEKVSPQARPSAIVIFTAHWESTVQKISAVSRHTMYHDIQGFPKEVHDVQYTPPGNPELAREIASLLSAAGIANTLDTERGLDHGVWTILSMIDPEAHIPVVALSVNPGLRNQEQYEIGRALAPLRSQGVLVIGSGGIVHNLRAIAWDAQDIVPWAQAFDDWVSDAAERFDTASLFAYPEQAPGARMAVPRNEHFVPFLLAMGAADATRHAEPMFRAFQMGTLSLSCWRFS